MKLLDTHVLIWRGDNDRRLGAETRDLVDYSLDRRILDWPGLLSRLDARR